MKTLAALFAVAAVVAGAVPAEAAPPRVEAYDCGTLAAQKGAANVWQTYFYGQRETLFDKKESTTASPCFTTEANCKAWLYWAQTDWQKYSTFRPCRKGLGY